MDRKEAAEILYEKYSDNEFYYAEYDKYPKGIGDGYQIALGIAIEALQEPERKKGQWISELKDDGDSLLRCFICNCPVSYFWGRTNFCPECGADMRGKE